MKHTLFFLFILLSTIALSKKEKIQELRNEQYRPQLHFSTLANRIGNPISLLKHDSTYHIYYQYNPHNLENGYYNWGHATSTDLIAWDEKKLALTQPKEATDSIMQSPWWGTVYTGNNKFNAVFCKWDEGIFRAESTNGDRFVENEKINIEGLEKCEPFLFYHEKSSKWIMFVFLPEQTEMRIYASTDNANWTKLEAFNLMFGAPQVIELQVDRKPDEMQYVILLDDGKYALADFDGTTFSLTKTFSYFDYGKECGGTVVVKEDNRAITMTLVNSKQHSDLASNGIFSFPTEISLHKTDNGIELFRKPIAELSKLTNKTDTWENKRIYPGLKNNLLAKVKGDCLYMKGIIDLNNCDNFVICFRCDKNKQGTELSYNAKRKLLNLKNVNLQYKPKDNKLDLEIIIDRSTIEIFIEGGRYVISTAFFPEPGNIRYDLTTKGGEIIVESLEVSSLNSFWHE